MRPSEVLHRAASYLQRHGVESPRTSAEVLLFGVLGTDRAGLYARTEGLTTAQAKAFGRALCQRCTGVPLQHLTGRQAFRHLDLGVRPGVFVPRPETEVLVDVALETLNGPRPVVVDVGTGTGAVALALKHERPDASVLATELSPEAIAVAGENAVRLGLDVHLLSGDLLAPLPGELRGRLDLVVSNPPYVAAEDIASLPAEVRADPELALLGGTTVHRRLAAESPRWLRPGGALVVEIADTQGEEVRAILVCGGFEGVRVVRDLAGRDRVVAGSIPVNRAIPVNRTLQ
jgi:release factor glutamine methyltransferase